MNKKTKDFMFSFVLIALGIYVVIEGMKIFRFAAGNPYRITEFTVSPAFLPVILGYALIFCSVLLFFQSLKTGQRKVDALKTHINNIKTMFLPIFKDVDILSMAGGLVFIAIYTFVLLGRLPFWLASLIFLMAIMFYLKAGKWWKIVIVSVSAIALILLLFVVGFNAAMP